MGDRPGEVDSHLVVQGEWEDIEMDAKIKLKAVKAYLEQYPQDIVMHSFIADLYCQEQDLKNIILHYETILKLNPQDVNNLYQLACMYHVDQRIKEANQLFQDALTMKKSSLIFCSYGLCLFDNKEFALAAQQFLLALAADTPSDLRSDSDADSDLDFANDAFPMISENSTEECLQIIYTGLEKSLLNKYLIPELAKKDIFEVATQFFIYYFLIKSYMELQDVAAQTKYLEDFAGEVEESCDAVAYYLLSAIYESLGKYEKMDEMVAHAQQFIESEDEFFVSEEGLLRSSANSDFSNASPTFFKQPKKFNALINDSNISDDEIELSSDSDPEEKYLSQYK